MSSTPHVQVSRMRSPLAVCAQLTQTIGRTESLDDIYEAVQQDAGLAAFLPTIRAEHIAAMAFIPLEGVDGVLGKFMLYYREPHQLPPEELQLATVIAAQTEAVGQSIALILPPDRRPEEDRVLAIFGPVNRWRWKRSASTGAAGASPSR